MFEFKACVVCLSTEEQLFEIGQRELRKLYNLISGFQTGEDEILANYLCYICIAYIRRFNAFRSKCQKTYNTLSSLSNTSKISTHFIQLLDRKVLGIEFPFEIENMPVISNTDVITLDKSFTTAVNSNNCWIPDVDFKCEEEPLHLKIESDDALSDYNVDDIMVPKHETHLVYSDEIKIEHTNTLKTEIEKAEDLKRNDKNTKKRRDCKRKQLRGGKKDRRRQVVMEYIASTPMTPHEQYQIILDRRTSRNYLESKFKCELCYKGFNSKLTYDNHFKAHNPYISGQLECDVCKMRMKTRRKMNEHMMRIHYAKYSCKVCSYKTYCRDQAINHNNVHKNVLFNCSHCDRTFTLRTSYLSHVRIKHPSTVVCRICGHSFVSKAGLNMHTQKAHTKDEVSVCEAMSVCTESALYCCECEVQFVSQAAFNTHLKTTSKHSEINDIYTKHVEPSNPSHKGKRFRSSLVPSGSRKCEVCDIVLPNYNQARKHYKADHPGYKYSKPYMCEVCGSTFEQHVLLVDHMRTHTKEKPFECPQCNKRFSLAKNRDRHILVHTGERPFLCPHCDKAFSQKQGMKLHVQTVHDKIPYAPWAKSARKRKAARYNESELMNVNM